MPDLRNHIFFWLFYITFTVGIYYVQEPNFWLHLTYELASLPAKVMMAYCTVYFILPRYLLSKKYLLAGIWLILILSVSVYLLQLLVTQFVYPIYFPDAHRGWLPENPAKLVSPTLDLIIVAALAVVAKLLKDREKQERTRMELEKINAQHELQLLRSQLHPHFLFNTLNGLYAYILEAPETAAEMVVKLSALLRFILYEGAQPLVQLEEELNCLHHYIGLEKIRYGPKLELDFTVSGPTESYRIAPLLLLPFMENAFKHGPARGYDARWIQGSVRIQQDRLELKLSNAKQNKADESELDDGIGLQNVRQRLKLLYGEAFILEINDRKDRFSVHLQVPLHKNKLG